MVGDNYTRHARIHCTKGVLRVDHTFDPDRRLGNRANPFDLFPGKLRVWHQAEGVVRRAAMNFSSYIDVRNAEIRGHSKISAIFAVTRSQHRCVDSDHDGLAPRAFSALNQALVECPVRSGVELEPYRLRCGLADVFHRLSGESARDKGCFS